MHRLVSMSCLIWMCWESTISKHWNLSIVHRLMRAGFLKFFFHPSDVVLWCDGCDSESEQTNVCPGKRWHHGADGWILNHRVLMQHMNRAAQNSQRPVNQPFHSFKSFISVNMFFVPELDIHLREKNKFWEWKFKKISKETGLLSSFFGSYQFVI